MREIGFTRPAAVLIAAFVLSTGLKTGGSTIGDAPLVAEPVRRALLVGIDTYLPPPAGVKARATSLKGAVNDVEAMRAVLLARYGFKAEDIHVLRNTEATRDRILSEIANWLVKRPARGDVSLFFYAGHGSQVVNSKSSEADGKDETIVPTEANRGGPDIRDKELRALFSEAVDNGVAVTAIFDSCHSGSIARGLWTPTSARFAAPDPRDVADGERRAEPETRGALILSASQDLQLSDEVEVPEEGGATHGVFSWALVKALRTMPVTESAERMFLRVRGLMKTVSPAQEPVLATSDLRRRTSLFGSDASQPAGTVIAVQALRSDGLVLLQAGIAAGLRRGAELKPANGDSEPTLRVVRDEGLASSIAEVIAGNGRTIQPGALFTLTRWAPPAGRPLKLWIRPSQMTASQIAADSQSLAALTTDSRLTWVDDLVASREGLSFLQRTDAGWQLALPDRPAASLGAGVPTFSQLAAILPRATTGAPRVIADFPLPRDVSTAFRATVATDPLLQLQATAAGADYALVGRVRRGVVEYAWVRPQLVDLDETLSVLPSDTDWVRLGNDATVLASRLRDLADRLSVIKNWLELESPPDTGTFPYHLSLRHVATGALKTSGVAVPDDPYGLVLTRDDTVKPAGVERRYVYVFDIDETGKSILLFPSLAGGNVENLFPLDVQNIAQLPREIRLVAPLTLPLRFVPGIDTFVLLTSAVALPNPAVLEGEAVRPPTSRGLVDPLTELLTSRGVRAADVTTPVGWSIERFTIRTFAR